MSNTHLYPVPEGFAKNAAIDQAQYQAMYAQSVNQPDVFWAEQANRFLQWQKPFTQVSKSNLRKGEVAWFIDGKLNVSVNCVDRHLPARAQQTALIWEGDSPSEDKHITYQELHDQVGRLANALRERGVQKGDRVCIYLPMIPEATYAMLACARIGAIHSVVFGGFSPEALKDRILDADCKLVITSDEGLRGGKRVPLKKNADLALNHCPGVHTCLVVKRTGGDVAWNPARDLWYSDLVDHQPTQANTQALAERLPAAVITARVLVGVLHEHGGRSADLPANRKALQEPGDDHHRWANQAGLGVGGGDGEHQRADRHQPQGQAHGRLASDAVGIQADHQAA